MIPSSPTGARAAMSGCSLRSMRLLSTLRASCSAGGDIYVYQRGDGQDVIDDVGTFSFGPLKAGLDFLMFKGGITSDDLKLVRDGASDDLKIVLLDKQGVETGDSILIKGEFGG